MINQFSSNKIFFHTDKLIRVLQGHVVTPSVYEVSLSGLCNCACAYCCCRQFHSDCYLSREDIDSLVEELKKSGSAVTLTGGGEPLTNRHFSYAVEQFGKNGIPVGVITNGLLLTPTSIDAIARFAHFVRISLDTAQPNEYRKIRGIDCNFEKLRRDLQALAKRKRELNSDILIGTQIVYVDQSVADIEQTILFSMDAKVDFVQIRPLDNIPYQHLNRNYEKYLSEKEHLSALSVRYSSEHFRVILNENKFSEYELCDVRKQYNQCLGANFTASIGHDMRLYFCCSHIGNPTFCLGDLRKESLESLLYSEKRRKMIENPRFSACQIQCRNHQLNKILHELTTMPYPDALYTIKRQSALEIPLHYEFL